MDEQDDTAASSENVLLPIVEEEARIGKERVLTGKVRVHTEVETINEIASAALEEQQVTVTRVPVDRPVAEMPSVCTDGDVTIVPVVEEIMVVEKRLVLKEEIHIHRSVTTEKVEVPVTLKKQRAIIERLGVDPQQNHSQENDLNGHD
jgi:uncharacterized protein (TIGR02271 family)